jgi:hypothetical protein
MPCTVVIWTSFGNVEIPTLSTSTFPNVGYFWKAHDVGFSKMLSAASPLFNVFDEKNFFVKNLSFRKLQFFWKNAIFSDLKLKVMEYYKLLVIFISNGTF